MSALLQRRLKERLAEALALLKLAGPPLTKDGPQTVGPPQVFVGDTPPKRSNSAAREVPCVVIVPLSGHLQIEDGYSEADVSIALLCVVYNPEDGDAEGGEADLAALLSAVSGALLPCAHGEPLNRRFILEPDAKGKVLAWVKGLEQPRPFLQATMTSQWRFKGWE